MKDKFEESMKNANTVVNQNYELSEDGEHVLASVPSPTKLKHQRELDSHNNSKIVVKNKVPRGA